MRLNKHTRKAQIIRYPINLYCEGLQEKLYFERLRDLINSMASSKKQIALVTKDCAGGSPDAIVRKAFRLCPQTQKATAVFDHDLKVHEFEIAIDLSKQYKIDAGYSNLNFDYWLILHKLTTFPSTATVHNTNAYEKQLKSLYGLQPNDDIKSMDIVKRMVSQITMIDISNAIKNCKIIDAFNKDNKIFLHTPTGNTYYENPDFSLHKIVEKILEDTL